MIIPASDDLIVPAATAPPTDSITNSAIIAASSTII
jgi:hypothetical protein